MNSVIYIFFLHLKRGFFQNEKEKTHTYIYKFQETCNTHQMLRSIRRRNRLDLEEKNTKKERFQTEKPRRNHRKLNSMEVQFFELFMRFGTAKWGGGDVLCLLWFGSLCK